MPSSANDNACRVRILVGSRREKACGGAEGEVVEFPCGGWESDLVDDSNLEAGEQEVE